MGFKLKKIGNIITAPISAPTNLLLNTLKNPRESFSNPSAAIKKSIDQGPIGMGQNMVQVGGSIVGALGGTGVDPKTGNNINIPNLDGNGLKKETGSLPGFDANKYKMGEAKFPEYDLARKRLKENLQDEATARREAMTRAFARLGNAPQGSQIKARDIMETDLAKQRQQGEEAITAQEAAAKRDYDFKNKVFNFDVDSKLRLMDQADRQYNLDKVISQFNMQIAAMEANKPTDLFSSLFGSIMPRRR